MNQLPPPLRLTLHAIEDMREARLYYKRLVKSRLKGRNNRASLGLGARIGKAEGSWHHA